jgi:hypothetical protein
MFVVYWLDSGNENKNDSEGESDGRAQFRRFGADALADALRFAESLRQEQAASGAIGFVTLCSENPQSVGKPGAADPPAGYDWKKRRP